MKKVIRAAILALSFAILVVGYYIYLSRTTAKTAADSANTEQTELEQVLELYLVRNYPETPREVVKTYNRIIALFYREELSNSQLEQLCDKVRIMMDPELADRNPREDYIAKVRVQIKDYRKSEANFVSSKVASSSEVEKKKVDGDQMAYVGSTYTIRYKNEVQITHQKYALRKDHDGKYRILAFTYDGE